MENIIKKSLPLNADFHEIHLQKNGVCCDCDHSLLAMPYKKTYAVLEFQV